MTLKFAILLSGTFKTSGSGNIHIKDALTRENNPVIYGVLTAKA